jgi:hypothetical protein
MGITTRILSGFPRGMGYTATTCDVRTTPAMTSRYQHSAGAVLLKAADMVADETARLMGEAVSEVQVVQLRREANS